LEFKVGPPADFRRIPVRGKVLIGEIFVYKFLKVPNCNLLNHKISRQAEGGGEEKYLGKSEK
jgi:hypothetical protein